MHRETTISREIKLLKNKFELLEKDRHLKSILHKSTGATNLGSSENADDSSSGHGSSDLKYMKKGSNGESTGELDAELAGESEDKRRLRDDSLGQHSLAGGPSRESFLRRLPILGRLFGPIADKLARLKIRPGKTLKPSRRKSNRIGSIGPSVEAQPHEGVELHPSEATAHPEEARQPAEVANTEAQANVT